MSSASGIKIAKEVVEEYTKLKLKKTYKFIILKLSDDIKEVVVEECGTSEHWDDFRYKLLHAKFKTAHGETKSPRYAIYDLHYETHDGPRTKIIFIAWSPDDAAIKPKMTYASSKESVRRYLDGIHVEIQANDDEDLEYKNVVEKVKKSN